MKEYRSFLPRQEMEHAQSTPFRSCSFLTLEDLTPHYSPSTEDHLVATTSSLPYRLS
jgi:hypothetical protein